MRFLLSLAADRSNSNSCVLPINYQYELSSWIYHTIHSGNPEFSKWLHDKGLVNQNRKFKFFTFSNLNPERYKVKGDRLIIESEYTELLLSFYLPEAVGHFITGLFRSQYVTLGDRISSAGFMVRQVEKLPQVEFKEKMKFRAISPLIISSKENQEQKHAQYLSPEEPEYASLLLNNLTNKYIALANCRTPPVACEQRMSDGSGGSFAAAINIEHAKGEDILCGMTLSSSARKKLIRIKAEKSDEVFLRGYLYDFELTAPVELMKIGYYGGFGEKNSLGFGCCEVFKS